MLFGICRNGGGNMLKKALLTAALVLATFMWLLPSGEAKADTCSRVSQTCVQRGNATIAGVVIENVCLQMATTENCTRSAPLNNCGVLEPRTVPNSQALGNNQCHLTSQTCLQWAGGQCNKYRRQYTCWNGPGSAAPASLTKREFLNLSETYTDNCAALNSDPNCSFQREDITEGSKTKTINLLNVTRAWWQKRRTYDCTNNAFVETCGDYENNPVCVELDTYNCLSYNAQGQCEYEERVFECDAESAFKANCEAINVCVGDNCTGVPQEPSDQYTNAAVWLNFLDQAAKDNNCDADPNADLSTLSTADCTNAEPNVVIEEPKLFPGLAMSCDTDLGKNCCVDPSNSWCRPAETELKAYRDAGATHFLGSRCTYWVFGICLTTTYDFCTYKGKFGRVFQEQVHRQTNDQFHPDKVTNPTGGVIGDYNGLPPAEDPCPPLTIEQLQTLDLGAMDLSEMFGDMLNKTNEPIEQLLVDRLSQEMGVFTTDVQKNYQ